MNVVVERLPQSQVVLDISADEQEFERALERAYRTVVKQVRLPGFRPGKAPRRIIEQLLGRGVLVEQADRDLLDPLYQQALEQEQLNPVGEPEVEIYQAEPLAFKVTVQVYPTIELGDYQSVRVEPRQVEISDEQVDEALDKLRDEHSPWEELAESRAAQEGDRVTIDVTITQGGEPYRELADSVFILGRDNLFPQLHEAILGMTIGETKTVEITFAADDQSADADMRGKTFTYQLTLKTIEEQRQLPLDDDFASHATEGRIASLDGLRDDVRGELRQTARRQARTEIGSEVVNAMSATATLDLPVVMIDKQIDSEIENLRNHLGQHNQTLEAHLRLENKTLDELREELRPEATRRLRNSLVLREIATREGITVNPRDIDDEIERLVGPMEDQERMRQIYSSGYIRNLLETEVFERKLTDRIITIATEGRGPFEPPETDEAVATTTATAEEETPVAEHHSEAEASTTNEPTSETAPATDEAIGVVPAGQHVTIGTAEAMAQSETHAPDLPQPASAEPSASESKG